MKTLPIFLSFILFSLGSAYAGLRFNHLIYICNNANGVSIHVLEPATSNSDLKGQLMAYNKSADSAPDLGIWCSANAQVSSSGIKISERALFGENPTSCKFTLDKEKMTAEFRFKKWHGYTSIGSPVISNYETMNCERKDEIVDY